MNHILSLSIDGYTQSFQYRFSDEGDHRNRYTLRKQRHTSQLDHRYYLDRYHAGELRKDELPLFDTRYRYAAMMTADGALERTVTKHLYTLLICDIDKLPRRLKSWRATMSYLRRKYKGAIVMTTPSGKAKVLFIVRQDVDDDTARLKALRYLMRDDGDIEFDHSTVATYKMYMTASMVLEFDKQKGKAVVWGRLSELSKLAETAELNMHRSVTTAVKADDGIDSGDRVYDGPLPAELLKLIRKSPTYKKMLRLLIAKGDADDNILLSQSWLASRCGCTQASISDYINKLIDSGNLVRTYKGNSIVARASRYRAAKLILELRLAYRASRRILPPPSEMVIDDGQWHAELFKLTRFFGDEAAYIAYCQSLPNIAAKSDRILQARKAWASHARRKAAKASAIAFI